ncbi:MAG: hypothetical protein ACLFQQ_09795 [Desulfococcaceae bacterium]
MSVNECKKSIEYYYSLNPIAYPILVKFELKQKNTPGQTPTLEVIILLQSREENEDSQLKLSFEGVRELNLSQPSLSEYHIPFIKIDPIKDSQWENLVFKVKDEEEGTFSFFCKNFEAIIC